MKGTALSLKCLCGSDRFSTCFTYNTPPKAEIRFRFSASGGYYREVVRCQTCGHFMSLHKMDMTWLYSGDYVSSNYGDEGILGAYGRILSLPPTQSDNTGRVRRFLEFTGAHFPRERFTDRAPSVLDVGSGLCIFLRQLKKSGWNCTGLDRDARLVHHAESTAGVRAVCASFLDVEPFGLFDAVTFNKVLEHVEDPVAMLRRAAGYLREGGFVYVELPDGEAASSAGSDREEFTIDHQHVFSPASVSVLIQHAGFKVLSIEPIHEPSGKYTLRAFMIL